MKKYKNLKIYRMDKMPYESSYEKISELEDYDYENIIKFGGEVIFYWYAEGCYEGCGQGLIRKNKKWYLEDFNHCSCYGPTEHLDKTSLYIAEKLDDIKEKCSEYLWGEVAILVKLAKQKGYK